MTLEDLAAVDHASEAFVVAFPSGPEIVGVGNPDDRDRESDPRERIDELRASGRDEREILIEKHDRGMQS